MTFPNISVSLFVVTIMLVPTIIIQCQGATVSDTTLLLNDLFANYSKDVRPFASHTDQLNVSVRLIVLSITDFDEITGILSVVACVNLIWEDFRLPWVPSAYGGLDEILISEKKLWVPKLFLLNPAKEFEAVGDDEFLARVFSNGNVNLPNSGLIKTTCDINVFEFPFDTQICSLSFIAWGYRPEEVNLTPFQNKIDFTYFTENALWLVTGSNAIEDEIGQYNGLVKFEMKLKRRSLFFVMNMIAPIVLLCILNPLVFILPVDSGERVSYSITIFLSFAVFMTILSDSLPPTSQPMAFISYFLVSAIATSTASVILTIVTMRFHFKDIETPVSAKALAVLHFLEFRYLFALCRKQKNKTSQCAVSDLKLIREKQMINETTDRETTIQKQPESVYNESSTYTSWKSLAIAYDRVLFLYFVVFTFIQWIVLPIALQT